MGYITAIIAIIQGFLKAIPIFDRWFTKSPEQKKEDIDAANQKEKESVEKGGRP